MPKEIARRQRQGSPPVIHFDPTAGQFLGRRRFGYYRDCAASQRILSELPAIGVCSWKRKKQIARIDAPRIIGKPGDLLGEKLGRQRPLEPFPREYRA